MVRKMPRCSNSSVYLHVDKDASNAKFFFLGHRLLTKRKSITLEQLKNVKEIFVFELIKRLTLAKLTFFSLAPIVDRPLTPGGTPYSSDDTLRFIINGGGQNKRGGFKDFEKLLNGGVKISGGGDKI